MGSSLFSSTTALAGRWDGASWSFTSLPKRGGEISGQLLGVSCVSGPKCFAVGSVNNDLGQFTAVDRHS